MNGGDEQTLHGRMPDKDEHTSARRRLPDGGEQTSTW